MQLRLFSPLRIIPAILIILVMTNCQEDPQPAKGYTIKGQITGLEEGTILYLFDMNQQKRIDSAVVKAEQFTMQGQIGQATHCLITNATFVPYANLMLEDTSFRMIADVNGTYLEAQVEGGYEQRVKNQLSRLTGQYDLSAQHISDSISKRLYEDDGEKQRMIDRYNSLNNQSSELLRGFILEQPNSLFSLDLLYRNRQYIPAEALTAALKKLTPLYQQASNALALQRFLEEGEVQIGQTYVEFTAETLEGAAFTLSSLQGKYLYLSFWEASCGPCRKENRFFSEQFDSLPDNLELISFYTGRSKENWATASQQDGIKWTNVSDLAGNHGSTATMYGVQGLPTSYLIGKDGKILKRFAGYTDNMFEQIRASIDVAEGA